jgi:hypothetical protein
MLDDFQDLIEELLGTPAAMRVALAGNPSETAVRLVAALTKRDVTELERFHRFLRQTEPHMRALPDVSFVIANPPETTATRDETLASFDTARGDLVSLLMNMTLRDWERQATHDEGGFISLAEEVERHVEFDEAMRAAIAGL